MKDFVYDGKQPTRRKNSFVFEKNYFSAFLPLKEKSFSKRYDISEKSDLNEIKRLVK